MDFFYGRTANISLSLFQRAQGMMTNTAVLAAAK
jgi:hypothetical protein